MSIDQQKLKALGTVILDADKDKFGLKTDGKGNVILSADNVFLKAILGSGRKYVVLADCHHDTREQLFTEANVAILKAHGVKKLFDEVNAKEKVDYNAEMGESDEALKQNSRNSEAVIGYKRLKTAGIELFASDLRSKENTPEEDDLLANKDQYDTVYAIIEAYKTILDYAKEHSSPKAELKEALKLMGEYCFHDKENPPQSKDRAISFMLISNSMKQEAKQALENPNLSTQDRECYGQQLALALKMDSILRDRETETYLDTVTSADLDEMKAYLKPDMDEIDSKMGVYAKAAIKIGDAINKPVSKLIKHASSANETVLVRWGLGHVDKRHDMDEMLGSKKTIVIATVENGLEFDNFLSSLTMLKDPPDYVYMPESTNAGGGVIPEKAISVAEYLNAQKQLKQSAQKTEPLHGRS